MPDRSAITDEAVLLWVARRTGVLEALLSTAGTPEAVAEAAEIPVRDARVLTRALSERGFFEFVDGTYEPTNRSLGFLTRRDARSLGSLPHRVDLLERFLALPEAVESGTVTDEPAHWTTHRLGAVAATDEATVRATVTAATREVPDADAVLDVGGAPGTYAVEFDRRGYDVTLCDRPDAAQVAGRHLARESVAVVDREFGGDRPLPGTDLAFVPAVTQRFDPATVRWLFERLADAVVPGGTVVLVDYRVEGSDRVAALALETLATTDGGEPTAPRQYRDWAGDAGFGDVDVQSIPGTDRVAVVATR